jgi:hypothetical protein
MQCMQGMRLSLCRLSICLVCHGLRDSLDSSFASGAVAPVEATEERKDGDEERSELSFCINRTSTRWCHFYSPTIFKYLLIGLLQCLFGF